MEAMVAMFASAPAAAAAPAVAGSTLSAAAASSAAAAATSAAAGIAAPAVAGAAASSAAGLGAAAGLFGAMTVSDILSGGLSTASIVGDLATASMEADQIERENQANRFNATMSAGQARNAAAADRIAILEKMNREIARNVAAAGASGIKPTGSVLAASEQARRQSELELQVGGRQARMEEVLAEIEGGVSQRETGGAFIAGLGRAAGKAATIADRFRRRG